MIWKPLSPVHNPLSLSPDRPPQSVRMYNIKNKFVFGKDFVKDLPGKGGNVFLKPDWFCQNFAHGAPYEKVHPTYRLRAIHRTHGAESNTRCPCAMKRCDHVSNVALPTMLHTPRSPRQTCVKQSGPEQSRH